MVLLDSFVRRAEARDLSVVDLIQAAETLKAAGPAAVAALYRAWLDHNGDHPLIYAVLFNYGAVQTDSGDLAGARDSLERAIALNADFHPAYINLGRVFERLGQPQQAVQLWSAMVDKLAVLNGTAIVHKTTALNQIARVLESGHQDAAAETMLRQSLDLDPRQREAAQHFLALRQRQCLWPAVAPWDRMDRAAQTQGMSPLSAAAHTDDPMFQLALAWAYNKTDVGAPAAGPMARHWGAGEGQGGRLRIGYLSSDLREHAVGYLMAEVFALHDRSKVEVFAYYCGVPATDALHARFRDTADRWCDISGLDDATAARAIADDGIHILVDLNGYTREGRTKLLALRPAPVIVNWLGYPGTTGSPYHHYIIADDWIVPPDHEVYYSEKVVRLPCYQPNDRRRTVADHRPDRAAAGLPDTGTVYCCFNGQHKITRATFERWLAILARVPGSVLWLLASNEAVHDRLRAAATAQGIAADRLVFAPKLGNADHLARYPLADLFLDTTPYGAHTTASDALWMGVPMLTWSGRSFAARVCGSLLRAVGLPDLVCASANEYVDRAVALGRDKAARDAYRDRLAAVRDDCVLFDSPRLVRDLEGLYAGMWADCRDGRLPKPDLRNLDIYLEVGAAVDHEAVEVQAIADYAGWWRDMLAARNAYRPIPADARFWPGD